MLKKENAKDARLARHERVRRKVKGTEERPRLAVFRSSEHIYAQVINDLTGSTVAAASSIEPSMREEANKMTKTQRAQKVGQMIASRALDKGVNQVVFDRGGHIYHGRVKALAEAAREQGLSF